MSPPPLGLSPVPFSALSGWEADDHLAAWRAFVVSAPAVLKRAAPCDKTEGASEALVAVCRAALALAKGGRQTRAQAKAFFEQHFEPHSIVHGGPEGLLTGYYEPVLAGARTAAGAFQIPIYRRPPDLVNMVAESARGTTGAFTHMRRTAAGLAPYLTRAEIEQGGLKGQGLELCYFRDPVDVFFLQVQGSGRVAFADGCEIRITYDGKNGYPYTSIGRFLIDNGSMAANRMSLGALKAWLRANRQRGQEAMWQNKSYVFFRELDAASGDSAIGALGTPLVAGRSLAVDTSFHSLGVPIYVTSPVPLPARSGAAGDTPLARLMVAHDVGSAIRGPERGDIYFGSGERAGRMAGTTKHPGRFFVLLARAERAAAAYARPR